MWRTGSSGYVGNIVAVAEQKSLSSLERGTDLSRIVAFVDAVFAIAITLLVLQLDVPTGLDSGSELWAKLKDQAPDFFAFAISFAVLGFYWLVNHRLMRTLAEFDARLIILILFYLAFIVLIPFSSQLLGENGDLDLAVAIYTANVVLVNAGLTLILMHAERAGLEKPEYHDQLVLGRKASAFTTLTFPLAVPLAFLVGSWALFIWWPLSMFNPYQRKRS